MLRISEFLIWFFVFLLTKLLFGVIRDLNGLWCSTENIYSIYWRSMPALLFDFELRLRLCACRASVSVYGCESAPKYLADTFGAPSCCLVSSRFVSLSPSLFVLHAQQILFWNCIWWLSIYKCRRGEKEREREQRRTQQCKQ